MSEGIVPDVPSGDAGGAGDAAGAVGGNGTLPGQGGEWGTQVARLPAELRDNPHISMHSDLASLAKDHVNAQGMIGRKGIVLPNSEDVSDINRFLRELGRPAEANGYVRPEGQDPEAMGVSGEFRDQVDSVLHQAGLTQAQYDKVVPAWAELVEAQQQVLETSARNDAMQQIEALKTEYGAAYSAKMSAGERALKAVFGDKSSEILNMQLVDGTLVGNNSDFIRGIIKMGEDHYVDDNLVDSRGVRVGSAMTPESAANEIKVKMATKEFTDAYFDKTHAGHDIANKEMEGLYAMAHPPRHQ